MKYQHAPRQILHYIYRSIPVKPTFVRRTAHYLDLQWRLINAGRVVTKTINGIQWKLELNQLIDSSLFLDGVFERDTAKVLLELAKPGSVVLDIGANVGCHTLPLAKAIGSQGVIIAFEPMQWAREKLICNIGLNQFRNIIVEAIALSDTQEEREIAFRTRWTINESKKYELDPPAMVRFMPLDDYLDLRNIQKVNLIKIDVDGFEYKILRGAQKTLKLHKPSIVMELGDYTLRRVGDSLEELVAFVLSRGYLIHREADLTLLPDYQAVKSSLGDIETTMNVVLLHRDKIDG